MIYFSEYQQCNITNNIHGNALNESKSVTMEDLPEFHYCGYSIDSKNFKNNAQKRFCSPITP